MRPATITGAAALAERMSAKAQVDATIPEAAMSSYLEMFLAHLRLLIGVPFEYLIPDSRLLPDESIRFFYVDRSWTDRLVDGALAVGKIGSREQAHHQAHSANVQATLDQTERIVRNVQANRDPNPTDDGAGIITGFLLRSAAVSGWPTMDVRAFRDVVPPPPVNAGEAGMLEWRVMSDALQLRTLRLERLSPSVLLALFDGVPKCVWCEEPHQAMPFTFRPRFIRLQTMLTIDRRISTGENEPAGGSVAVPVRAANTRVIAVQELRNRLHRLNDPALAPQTGSAALAIECMSHPWRQRFQDGSGAAPGGFVATNPIAARASDAELAKAVGGLVR
ncbi:MAG: hypothetical protein ABI446_01435, partial [Gemmatimonadaceae bacterium]